MSGHKLTLQHDYVNKFHQGVAILPQQYLELNGPLIAIEVRVHPDMVHALKQLGKPVPDPIKGQAMIDSGVQVTAIDISVAESLQLQKTSKVEVVGIGGRSEGYTSACSIHIPGLPLTTSATRAHCHDLTKTGQNIIALIGRDILRMMTFSYDGINGQVRLVYPQPLGANPPKKGGSAAQQNPKRNPRGKRRR